MKLFKSSFIFFAVYFLAFLVLAFHLYDLFSTFQKSLSSSQLEAWYGLFGVTACLFAMGITQAIYEWKSRKQYVHFSIFNIIGLLIYLCYYLFSYEDLIPNTMRGFMHNELNIYGIFVSIVIGLGLFLLIKVASLKPNDKAEQGLYRNWGLAFIVPLATYFLYKFVISAINTPETISLSFIVTFFVLLTTGVIYAIIRGLIHAKFIQSQSFQTSLKVIFTLILPIVGILINQSLEEDFFSSNIFGDFRHPFIWVLLFVTAFVLIFPSNKLNHQQREFFFFTKLICLPYSLYFSLVFLPFLPVSILLTIFFGLGFLMLAPIILLIIHIQSIAEDWQYLHQDGKRQSLILSCAAFAFVPLAVLYTMFTQSEQLQNLLYYSEKYNTKQTTSPKDYSEKEVYSILDRVTKQGNSRMGDDQYLPFLTPLRNKIVSNGLFLKTDKSTRIKEIYTGFSNYSYTTDSRRNYNSSNQALEDFHYTTETKYDDDNGYFSTWVNLKIDNDSNGQQEFVSLIDLPNGVYVNNMYLDISGRREYGLMAEKKAADWLYNQIRRVRRDPAILKYVGRNTLSYRIFPFQSGETRTAGIQFIHKNPTTIRVKNKEIELGELSKANKAVIETDASIYVSKQAELATLTRKPEPVVFVSNFSNDEQWYFITNKLRELANQYDKPLNQFEINIVGKGSYKTSAEDFINGKTKVQSGGFFLEKPLLEFLANYQPNRETFPRIHVIADRAERMILNESIAFLSNLIPEENYMYLHTPDADAHLLYNSLDEEQFSPTVRLYKAKNNQDYFAPFNESTVFVKNELAMPNDWEAGAQLQVKYEQMVLNPSQIDQQWVNGVKQSIETNVLSPATSLMSLENEMQKEMLKLKQKQVLNGDAVFDAEPGSTVNQMDEPAWLYFLLPLLLWLFIRRKKRRMNKVQGLMIT